MNVEAADAEAMQPIRLAQRARGTGRPLLARGLDWGSRGDGGATPTCRSCRERCLWSLRVALRVAPASREARAFARRRRRFWGKMVDFKQNPLIFLRATRDLAAG